MLRRSGAKGSAVPVDLIFLQDPQQRQSQHETDRGFACADGGGVVDKQRAERLGRAAHLPGEQRAHEHGIAEDRGNRRADARFAPCGKQRGEQRCRRAENEIEQTVGTQHVGQKTADEQPPHRFRHQKRQHAQRLGKAQLHRSVGKAQRRGNEGERAVGCGDDRSAGQRFGGKMHEAASFLFFCDGGYQTPRYKVFRIPLKKRGMRFFLSRGPAALPSRRRSAGKAPRVRRWRPHWRGPSSSAGTFRPRRRRP